MIAVALLAVGLAQEAPIAETQLSLRVSPPDHPIEFGVPFELRVVQTWQKDFELEAWGVEKLAPLTAELVETTRRESATHIEETRRFECYAFGLDEVLLPALFLRARSREDGTQRVALGEELELSIGSSLPDGDGGVMELPRDLFPAPFPWGLALTMLLVLSSASFVVLRIRSARPLVEPEVAPEPAHVVARRRIEGLRAQRFETRDEVRGFHVDLSALVREYLEGCFDVESSGKTTDEFFADPATARALEPGVHERLRALLAQSDLVKYAGQASGAEEREALLDTLEEFVEETRPMSSDTGEEGLA